MEPFFPKEATMAISTRTTINTSAKNIMTNFEQVSAGIITGFVFADNCKVLGENIVSLSKRLLTEEEALKKENERRSTFDVKPPATIKRYGEK